ncbi:MAG: winged helix-turn-helix domain-containing protein [Bacteroidales bacterium]
MKRIQIEDNEYMQDAIQQEILRNKDSRYDHRLHGVLLVSKGMSSYQAGTFLGHDSTTIQRWVNNFNRSGFAGLYDKEKPGRPTSLDEHQWEKVSRDLRKQPKTFGYSQNLWDGKLLAHHLQSHYGVEISVRQCQRIFHKFGFRRRKPRPVSAQADLSAQMAFKKTSKVGTKSNE